MTALVVLLALASLYVAYMRCVWMRRRNAERLARRMATAMPRHVETEGKVFYAQSEVEGPSGNGGQGGVVADSIDAVFQKVESLASRYRAEALSGQADWNADSLTEWVYKGLKCRVCRVPHLGCINGYVLVPPEHPCHGLWYDDVRVEVHGGLTFCHKQKDGTWFGFDTAHCGDLCSRSPHVGDRIWTRNDVIEETNKLAEQLAGMAMEKQR